MSNQENDINVGSPEYDAKDDYIKSLANIFYKINNAADEANMNDLAWKLNYYIDILLNRIIDPTDRDIMREAKKSIIIFNKTLKIQEENKKEMSQISLDGKRDAVIEANKIIFGELITYFDRYYGFETQLGVML